MLGIPLRDPIQIQNDEIDRATKGTNIAYKIEIFKDRARIAMKTDGCKDPWEKGLV